MRIDQLLPNFSFGDAIGNHTLALRETFRRWGFESEIFTHLTHHKLTRESRYFEEYSHIDHPDNLLFYHYSIGSIVSSYFANLRCRRVMIYHNITPAEFFRGVNRRAQLECERGRKELARLSHSVDLALGDSEYNRRELGEMGFSPTGVLPIFIPFEDYDQTPDKRIMKEYGDGRPNILHVGRFAPNKKIEDLIKTFHFFRRLHPDARLILVGTDVNMENYSTALKKLVDELKLDGVVFAGHVTFRELLAWYRTASIYLTMSEHEGFCVPLVESMIVGVPVVAYASSAVPDTLGDGGVLVGEKNFPVAAEVMHEIFNNGNLRRSLIENGRRRLEYFGRSNRESMLQAHLGSLGVDIDNSR